MALRQQCQGAASGDDQRSRHALCEGLDELIAWLGRKLAQQDAIGDADGATAARQRADHHFLGLLIMHRRALAVGDDHTLCRELVERIGPLWVAHRRDSMVATLPTRG